MNIIDLNNKKCESCNKDSIKLTKEDVDEYLKQVPLWGPTKDYLYIERKLQFKNFKQTMFFINALAYVCEVEGHHPDVEFGFNYCNIKFTTHELNSLSINDFICAKKIDDLLK